MEPQHTTSGSRTLTLAASAALLLALAGTTSPARAQSGCTSDDQCKGDRICQEGRCVDAGPLVCGDDMDCPGDLICVEQACVESGDSAPAPAAIAAPARAESQPLAAPAVVAPRDDQLALERVGDARRRLRAGDALSGIGIGLIGAGMVFGTVTSGTRGWFGPAGIAGGAGFTGTVFHGIGAGVYDAALMMADEGRASLGLPVYAGTKLQRAQAMYIVSMTCQGLAIALNFAGRAVSLNYEEGSFLGIHNDPPDDWDYDQINEWNDGVVRYASEIVFAFTFPAVFLSVVPAIIATAMMHAAVAESIGSVRDGLSSGAELAPRRPARRYVVVTPTLFASQALTGVGVAGRW